MGTTPRLYATAKVRGHSAYITLPNMDTLYATHSIIMTLCIKSTKQQGNMHIKALHNNNKPAPPSVAAASPSSAHTPHPTSENEYTVQANTTFIQCRPAEIQVHNDDFSWKTDIWQMFREEHHMCFPKHGRNWQVYALINLVT